MFTLVAPDTLLDPWSLAISDPIVIVGPLGEDAAEDGAVVGAPEDGAVVGFDFEQADETKAATKTNSSARTTLDLIET
jgi:hypothetical protein